MQKRYLLKIIILITITVDHIGLFLFPQLAVLRIIGRITFPIVAFQAAEGYKYTKNLKRYYLRLALFAGISQIPYSIYFGLRLNPIFTVLFGLTAIILWHKNTLCKILALALCVAGVAIPVSYGAYGIFMVFIFDAFSHLPTFRTVMVFLALNYVFYIKPDDSSGIPVQVFSVLALPFIYLIPDKEKGDIHIPKIFTGRLFYYIYYPAHITLLILISKFR